MSWLERLKAGNTLNTSATNATNTPYVAFVAGTPENLPKIAARTDAANDSAHDPATPENAPCKDTTVPVTSAATAEEFRAAPRAEDGAMSANEQPADPDRWCWPCSSAMNTRELETFVQRLEKFTSKGLCLHEAEALADRLVQRDREADDRALCVECSHLQGRTGRWRCGSGLMAGETMSAAALQLPSLLTRQLQHCAEFTNAHG